MSNPLTLFTGQWVDMPLEKVASLAHDWGYEGLELACSGNHLDVGRAVNDDAYLKSVRDLLNKYNLGLWAISNHLTGQAVCDDPIDFRHQAILPSRIWGEGEEEAVRQRASLELKETAIVARKLGVDTVVGFTGSKIWKYVAMFPPVPAETIEEGYEDFAKRWNPILDVFDSEGVRFALEVHPGEIAYDYWTSVKTLEAINHRQTFGFNWDPSHLVWQGIDPEGFILDFADRIYHVDCKDTRMRVEDGKRGILGSHLPWGDPRRRWDFVSTGRGDNRWEDNFRALRTIGYEGPISVEWEDAGMERERGAEEARKYLADLIWDSPASSFDSAFSTKSEEE